MRANNHLATFPWPLTLGTQTIFLPLRRSLIVNIEEQQDAGFPFELGPDFVTEIDRILNYSLLEEYRAPTPAQVRLVLLMARELGLDGEKAITKKQAVAAFIEKYRFMFDEVMAQKTESDRL